jgi:hypothetical protein
MDEKQILKRKRLLTWLIVILIAGFVGFCILILVFLGTMSFPPVGHN